MALKIVSIVGHALNKHENPEFAVKVMKDWTAERRDYFLEKLDWMQSSIDKGNREAYRIAHNQLKVAIVNQKETLDKLHDKIIFTE